MRAFHYAKRLACLISGILLTAGILLSLPAAASASPAFPGPAVTMPCGYDGYHGSNQNQPYYTHCGRGQVQIKVNHFFWQTTYFCANPGTQQIPQGDSSWSIIDAEYDGNTC